MSMIFKAYKLGLQDALSGKNLRYFFYSFLIVVVIAAVIYLSLFGIVADLLSQFDSSEGWLYWVASVVIHAVLGVLGYILIPSLILLVLLLFSEQIIHNIYQRHGSSLNSSSGSNSGKLAIEVIKIFSKYLLLMLALSPSLLLGVGYIVYFILGYLLFRRLLLIDILGVNTSAEEIREQSALISTGRYRTSSLTLYLLSLVPVINLLVPYLAICIITNESILRDS